MQFLLLPHGGSTTSEGTIDPPGIFTTSNLSLFGKSLDTPVSVDFMSKELFPSLVPSVLCWVTFTTLKLLRRTKSSFSNVYFLSFLLSHIYFLINMNQTEGGKLVCCLTTITNSVSSSKDFVQWGKQTACWMHHLFSIMTEDKHTSFIRSWWLLILDVFQSLGLAAVTPSGGEAHDQREIGAFGTIIPGVVDGK